MKIVCDSCGAKYSIADEKVQGKVFKIRCKKCSNVIVVKGTTQPEAAPADSDLGGSTGAAEWYVVIDGEQVGPVTAMEIDSYFMSGQIALDTYGWRDGMGDWQHIADIPEFAHLTQDVAGPNEATTIADSNMHGGDEGDSTNVMQSPLGAGAEVSDATVSDTPGAMGYGSDPYPSDPGYGDEADYGGEPGYGDEAGYGDDAGYGYAADAAGEEDEGYSGFGSFESGGIGGELAATGGDDDGGGMFAAFDGGSDSDFMSFGDSGGEAPAPMNGSNGSNGSNGAAAMSADLVGQRNENSVLFSLSSLDSVQAVPGGGGGGAGGGGSVAPSGGGGTDVPVTEGSGLIDIQALASAHKSMGGAGSEASEAGGIDPFSQGTMAMPALMPMGSHKSNKGLIIAVSLAAVAVIALVIVVAVVVTGKGDAAPEQKEIVKTVIVEKEVERPVDSEKAAQDEAEAAAAAEAALKEAPKKVEDDESSEKEDSKKAVAASSKKERRPSRTKKKTNDEPDDPAPKAPTKKKDGIDNILDDIDRKGKEVGAKSEPASSAKKKLSKSDVKNTINRYMGRINTCANSHNSAGKKGSVKVKFFIRPNGRVRGASVVSSGFKGTDVGDCVQKVVGSMKFPSTSASNDVPVTYPFILR